MKHLINIAISLFLVFTACAKQQPSQSRDDDKVAKNDPKPFTGDEPETIPGFELMAGTADTPSLDRLFNRRIGPPEPVVQGWQLTTQMYQDPKAIEPGSARLYSAFRHLPAYKLGFVADVSVPKSGDHAFLEVLGGEETRYGAIVSRRNQRSYLSIYKVDKFQNFEKVAKVRVNATEGRLELKRLSDDRLQANFGDETLSVTLQSIDDVMGETSKVVFRTSQTGQVGNIRFFQESDPSAAK